MAATFPCTLFENSAGMAAKAIVTALQQYGGHAPGWRLRRARVFDKGNNITYKRVRLIGTRPRERFTLQSGAVMAKHLVIVESPAKAKTIGRYLGSDYQIAASVGHIRDLPSSSLGVDVRRNFKPMYITMRGKESVVRDLKKRAETADRIYIATDPDREGEAIAWHLSTVLKLDPQDQNRITFNEITAAAVRRAVEEPRSIDMNLVNAQQARRILDRLVGYELSPLLWKKVRKGLSAGRVQSVATRILVEREEEIRAFKPEEYWLVDALLQNSDRASFRVSYHGRDEGKARVAKRTIHNKEEADALIQTVRDARWVVHSVRKGHRKRQPYAPFTTSTLQQEASRRLGFSSGRCMSIAQQLYEGVDLPGAGPTALITYIRTDSVRVSKEAQEAAQTHIRAHYGERFLPSKPNFYRNKNSAQDAHEAIRPAHFDRDPASLQTALSSEQYRLYKLIWDRFLASQMAAAQMETLRVDVLAGRELFRCSGSHVTFPGFLAAYAEVREGEESKTGDRSEIEQEIPPLSEAEILDLKKLMPEQKFTQAPPRYSEASLIKAMEELGIGRPSTYAPTISTILARNYVSKEKRQLVPTDLGFVVTDLLREHFGPFINVHFTAQMEEKLDTVERGENDWVGILSAFYPAFHASVVKAQTEIAKVEMPQERLGKACPSCGEGELIVREGRYGKFIACSRFPDCTYTENVQETVDAHCPRCHAPLLKRRSRRGSIFYVCSKQGSDPNCDFISWYLPLDGRSCEICNAYMVLKRYKGKSYPACSNPDCPSHAAASAKRKKTSARRAKSPGKAESAEA